MTVSAEKDAVRRHWEADPCGSKLASSAPGSAEFFAEIERSRYELEPFIPAFAEFERWADRDVLEIGVGLGTDFVRFARAGARASGIDLTDAAVRLVEKRLELEGLDAAVRTGDAETLPYADDTFDLVYSWGVLHHTPNTDRALEEIRRVLRPGGEARVMLYSRRSWVVLGLWLRYGLARGRPWMSGTDLVARHMESPGTKAYTGRELEAMFSAFSSIRFRRFPTPYDRRVGGPLVDLLGPRFAWFVGIVAHP